MGSDVTSLPGQPKLGSGLTRYRSAIELCVAAIVGVVVLPAIFQSLRAHDTQLGGRVSAVDLAWLVLALVAIVFIVRSRSAVVSNADRATSRFLDSIPLDHLPRPTGQSTSAASSASSLQPNGTVVVHSLIDIILLFILQAVVRQPLVSVLGGEASIGIVDGAFVVVVVLVAVSLLIRLRQASRPLIERLATVGLDQIVPTAGFTSGSAAATFAARLSTTTARLAATSSPSAGGVSRPVQSPTSPSSTEATVPAAIEATVLADAHEPGTVDSTEVASASEETPSDATVVAPGLNTTPADATVVPLAPEPAPAHPHPPAEGDLTIVSVSDQTVIVPPPVAERGKDGTV